MDRKEHLEWCKIRAREYIQNGDYQNAVISMISDLGKHPETVKGQEIAGMLLLTINMNSQESVSRFIEGFN